VRCILSRPKKFIDPEQVEKLAGMHCTTEEIASFFDVSRDTIERRFQDIILRGRQMGKAKLRRLQWQTAESGNVIMQIWLGKQLLNQSDAPKTDGDAEVKPSVYKLIDAK
jgi:hypothetical protein